MREGYDIGKVNSAIQGHTRNATAVRTKSMLTDVSDSLSGVADSIGLLIIAIWALALIILIISFAMIVNERRREAAVLRLVGMSRGMLSRMLFTEALLCGACGGLAGIALGAAAVFPFSTLIEQSLGLPYLMPQGGAIALTAALALLASIVAGALAALWAGFRLSRTDPGNVLREG